MTNKVRNGYRDSQGYIVERFICENAPTNRVRPALKLNGHLYYSYSWGNGAGARWGAALRTKTCPKCGGKMIPIDKWEAKEGVDEPRKVTEPADTGERYTMQSLW